MIRKTILTGALLGLLASPLFAADTENPLNPLYNTPQQKKYFMEFCKIDLNSDGMVRQKSI